MLLASMTLKCDVEGCQSITMYHNILILIIQNIYGRGVDPYLSGEGVGLSSAM